MKKTNLLPLIGIIFFIYIISGVDLISIGNILLASKIEYIAISLLLTIPIILLKGLKWKMIVKSYNIDYDLMKSTRGWLIGFFLGIITPGRIGDLTRAYYLKRDKSVSGGQSLTTVVIDRIIDIALLFSFALVGLATISSMVFESYDMIYTVGGVFVLFLIAVFMLTRKGFVKSIVKPLAKRFLPEKYNDMMGRLFHDFYEGIVRISKVRIAASVIVGIIIWILSIAQYYLLALSLSINLPYLFFFAITPIVALLDSLPISFSGVGTRDAALLFFFSIVAISAETAVSLSLLLFLLNYLLVGLFGFLLWVKNPIRIDHSLNNHKQDKKEDD